METNPYWLTTKLSGFDVAGIAPGLVTVTARVAALTKSAAGTCTVIEFAATVVGVRTSDPKLTTVFAAKFVPVIVRYCKSALPLSAMGGDKFEIAGKTGGGGGGVVNVKNAVPERSPTVAVTDDIPATRPVTMPPAETLDVLSVGAVQTTGPEIVNGLPY